MTTSHVLGLLFVSVLVSRNESNPYCKYHRTNNIDIECDVSQLKSGHVEWRAFDSRTNTSLCIYRCTNGDDCGIVVPILNGSVGFDSVSESMMVSSTGMEIPEITQYYNVYSQFQCWGGDNLTLVCDTPDMLAAVINPTCSTPLITDNDNVTIVCRAATYFKPNDYNFTITSNKRTRNITTAAIDYYEYYSPLELEDVRYYDVNFTLETDLLRLRSGYHKFTVAVNHKNFRSSIASAVLNVTSKLDFPNCDPPLLSNDSVSLYMRCTTKLVFPQLQCHFNTWTNKTLRYVLGEVTYSTRVDPTSSPTGYLSECTYHVNISHLGPGAHEFQVVMYTNSTSNSTATGKVTAPFQLAMPTVRLSDACVKLADSLYGKVWTNITCLCLLESRGIPAGSVAWSVNDEVRSSDVVTAFFSDFINNVKYVCIPETPLKVKSSGVQLQISVPRPAHITSFTANSSSGDITTNRDATVSFRCDARGLPPPTLLFGGNSSQRNAIQSGIPFPINFTNCLDTGQYCCTVENNTLYKVESKCLSVFIRCPQQLQNKSSIVVIAHPRDQVNFTISVYGFPAPNAFTLSKITVTGLEVISSSRYLATYTPRALPFGSIEFEMSLVEDDDFANYTLAFSNGVGDQQSAHFSIIKEKTTNNDKGSTSRNIAIGVSCGALAVIIAIVVIILVKRGLCKRDQGLNKDSELSKLSNK